MKKRKVNTVKTHCIIFTAMVVVTYKEFKGLSYKHPFAVSSQAFQPNALGYTSIRSQEYNQFPICNGLQGQFRFLWELG